MSNFEAGARFGRLTIQAALPRKGTNRQFLCKCDCGAEKTFNQANLSAGRSTSCGCWRDEFASQRAKRHGEAGNSNVGQRPTSEYKTWLDMKARCYSPSAEAYQYYGARGIRMCSSWLTSFEAFLAAMGRKPSQKHSIERKDNDGDYEPGNCRWATALEQAQNTRRSRYVLLAGERMTITSAGRRLGVHPQTAAKRLPAG
jgi:hypothetical protein